MTENNILELIRIVQHNAALEGTALAAGGQGAPRYRQAQNVAIGEIREALAALEASTPLPAREAPQQLLTPSQRHELVKLLGEYGSARFWAAENIINKKGRPDQTPKIAAKFYALLAKPLSEW